MSARHLNDLPCGQCDTGVYSYEPFVAGIETFRGIATRKQALAAAPKCKCESAHICFGARDFILSMDWPLTDDRCAELMAEAAA
jgi:hypothetical protein